MGKLTPEVFGPSCCEGGLFESNAKSAHPCGCDEGANWTCHLHHLKGRGVYIAAPWVHKQDAIEADLLLKANGVRVVSTWYYRNEDVPNTTQEAADDVMAEAARLDIEEVESAGTLLYLNLAKSEGKATELGMALAMYKFIAVVGGKQNNVFLHSFRVTHVADLDEAVRLLQRVR